MKIFIGQLGHETNTFSQDLTDIERFSTAGNCEGEELRTRYAQSNHYLGGMIKATAEANVEVFYGISVATAGPLITRKCLDYYVKRFCEALIPYADQVYGLCLALHGAGCAEGIDDIECYTLRHVREIVGMDMPITISLDLHGNISKEMVQLTNGIFGIKCYPHTDCDEAGYMAMQILIQFLQRKLKLGMHFIRLPLLLPFQNMAPTQGVGKHLKDFISDIKKVWAN
jgi:microcystin degradation protein MlrC